jgi:hypothetical protein
MRRILTGLIAVTLLGVAPVSLAAGSASAGTPSAAQATSASRSTSARALPRREITSKVLRVRGNNLRFKGNVSPGHVNKSVFIMKRDCIRRCQWHVFNKVKTDRDGRFRSPISAPRRGSDYFRAMVKKHGGYARSYSDIWRTFTD